VRFSLDRPTTSAAAESSPALESSSFMLFYITARAPGFDSPCSTGFDVAVPAMASASEARLVDEAPAVGPAAALVPKMACSIREVALRGWCTVSRSCPEVGNWGARERGPASRPRCAHKRPVPGRPNRRSQPPVRAHHLEVPRGGVFGQGVVRAAEDDSNSGCLVSFAR
jgi:hypothetical protein